MSYAGLLASLHRYPVKSMMGEELDAAEVTQRGVLGDRAYALCDVETGKIVSAKNPLKWPDLFFYRAVYIDSPTRVSAIPPVRVTLPDGTSTISSNSDFTLKLSAKLGRSVKLLTAPPQKPQLEEYWPDLEELAKRDVVTEENIPEGTFFDAAPLHIVTTATLERLHELNPESRFEPARFRPNLLIDSGPQKGFVENDWIGKTIAIGADTRIQVIKPCPRCVMTILAQGDLPNDPAVLKTAARHNSARVGVYATVAQMGTIRVGDTVTII